MPAIGGQGGVRPGIGAASGVALVWLPTTVLAPQAGAARRGAKGGCRLPRLRRGPCSPARGSAAPGSAGREAKLGVGAEFRRQAPGQQSRLGESRPCGQSWQLRDQEAAEALPPASRSAKPRRGFQLPGPSEGFADPACQMAAPQAGGRAQEESAGWLAVFPKTTACSASSDRARAASWHYLPGHFAHILPSCAPTGGGQVRDGPEIELQISTAATANPIAFPVGRHAVRAKGQRQPQTVGGGRHRLQNLDRPSTASRDLIADKLRSQTEAEAVRD